MIQIIVKTAFNVYTNGFFQNAALCTVLQSVAHNNITIARVWLQMRCDKWCLLALASWKKAIMIILCTRTVMYIIGCLHGWNVEFPCFLLFFLPFWIRRDFTLCYRMNLKFSCINDHWSGIVLNTKKIRLLSFDSPENQERNIPKLS